MIGYELPSSVEIGGRVFRIRTDYRAMLDIISALNDPELTDEDRAIVALGIFFEDELPEDLQEGLNKCMWFIAGGKEEKSEKASPKLVDWEQDFQWIVAPINHMVGRDVRSMDMHWWTFLSYYYEIGDCTFAQIVRIRDARAKGKKLDKGDREWARQNADLVLIKQKYTEEENSIVDVWTKGVSENG